MAERADGHARAQVQVPAPVRVEELTTATAHERDESGLVVGEKA
jgi:hypothetical protein